VVSSISNQLRSETRLSVVTVLVPLFFWITSVNCVRQFMTVIPCCMSIIFGSFLHLFRTLKDFYIAVNMNLSGWMCRSTLKNQLFTCWKLGLHCDVVCAAISCSSSHQLPLVSDMGMWVSVLSGLRLSDIQLQRKQEVLLSQRGRACFASVSS